MAEDNKNKFQSIYGDSEDEFDIDDVSDETTSISKEEIEAAIAAGETGDTSAEEPSADEQPVEAPAAEEESAPVEKAVTEENASDAKAPESAGEESGDVVSADEKLPEDEASSKITIEEHSYSSRERRAPRHEDSDPDDVYEDKDDEEREDEQVGILSYILHAILFTIPVIGTILMLVYIISDKRNAHLRHFAQIWLVTLLLIAIGAYAAITMLGIA